MADARSDSSGRQLLEDELYKLRVKTTGNVDLTASTSEGSVTDEEYDDGEDDEPHHYH
jgi:hypothetical protein